MDNADSSNLIKNTLGDISTKIQNCESLSKVLNRIKGGQQIPDEWDCEIEKAIIELYVDLVEVCKHRELI